MQIYLQMVVYTRCEVGKFLFPAPAEPQIIYDLRPPETSA